LKPIDSTDLPHYRSDTSSQIVDTHGSAIGEVKLKKILTLFM